MKLISKMEFGSIVYGTNLPTSDKDYKQVFLPTAEQILLGRVKQAIVESTKKDNNVKNSSDDVDVESFSLCKYLKLLSEGQTVSLDMLFVPKKHLVLTSPIWEEIQRHKDKILHSQYNSFVGYARTQANRYGIRGSRVAEVRGFVDLLKSFNPYEQLRDNHFKIVAFCADKEHTSFFADKINPSVYLYECCDRKAQDRMKVKDALQIFEKVLAEYGNRSLMAEKNEGVDWKSLQHAIRILNQSKELLLTGNIEFPRPNADFLLQIRKGELPYKQVAELIENGIEELETTVKDSVLPEKPDQKWIDEFVCSVYKQVIQN
jgi:hypothetical protein